MATVGITFHGVQEEYRVPFAEPRASEAITSSASSQASSNTAANGETVTIATTGAVWVAVGRDAAAGTNWLIPSGGMVNLNVATPGTVRVIDA